MSSPITEIEVLCPRCGKTYKSFYRASMNLTLDNFDEEYIEKMTTGVCPSCGHKVKLGALVVRRDGAFELREGDQ